MEGRLKQCSAMHVSAAAPEQSGRSKSELAYENRDLSEKLRSCESENANLSARNRELRKEVVVLQAENEALRRQKRMDEDTLEHLRKRICESERKERHLLVTVAARELEAGSPLHEKEFQEIIRSSQQQLTAFYEEKMVAMQAEMDRFYAEASACIQEKDAIIAALKEEEA
ncbi:conserved hypothetical protein [Leishmania major strain Friedlin]|uniref:Uncharacterized protein n=1 Tax=Leishmania major TaxID=5664 RepID=Q4QH79_LEIMA|nr:conserved hypothetical protein [Leishmania major strain Friedlin]CAG9570123.1 hypothetical_protein_-_conserved [Leishmania major strain Friedlin]CAJ02319.1 conserved hypothetical protein [Leishmania major strain Friedlin]|eukprot:XP_001681469.1 conserved hypothetical protein [Leishmania major strain Friedlin]